MTRKPSTNAFLNDFFADVDRLTEDAFAKLHAVVVGAEVRMARRYGLEPPPPSVN